MAWNVAFGSLHIVTEEKLLDEATPAEADEEGAEAEKAATEKAEVDEGASEEAEVVEGAEASEGVEASEESEADESAEAVKGKPVDKFRNGNIVIGTVINVNFQQAEIDLGEGEIGVLSSRHYAAGLMVDLTGEIKVGDEVEAAVLIRADHNNRVVLSRTWARSQRAWKKIMEAKQSNTVIEAVIVEAVKGGFSVEIDDARGFLPSSLVVRSELAAGEAVPDEAVPDVSEPENSEPEEAEPEEAEPEEAESDVSEPENSEPEALDTEEAEPEEAEPEEAEPDEAEPAEAEPAESSPDISHTSDKFLGQIVKCKVIEANPEKSRYVLSHKAAVRTEQRMKEKERVASLEKGTIVSGKVVALEDYGAFIDIGGARGLLHRTEMAWNHPAEPGEILQMGESVFCQIVKINKEKAQVGLSLRLGENPIGEISVGQRLTGKVDRLAYAGALVALDIPDHKVPDSPEVTDSQEEDEEGSDKTDVTDDVTDNETSAATAPTSPKCSLHGFVHVSEMSEYPLRRPQRVVLPGDKVAVKVIEVQRKQRRIGLSIIDAIVPDELASNGLASDEPVPVEPVPDEPVPDEPVSDEPVSDELPEESQPGDEEASVDVLTDEVFVAEESSEEASEEVSEEANEESSPDKGGEK